MTHALPLVQVTLLSMNHPASLTLFDSLSPKLRKIPRRRTLLVRIIDILNRQTSSLRNKKPGDGKHNNSQTGVDKTRLCSQITRVNIIHVRGHKGEEPARNGTDEETDRLRVLAETVGANFRADCP